MEIICTLLLFVALVLNNIELSSQSQRLLDDGPNPGSPCGGPSPPGRNCSPPTEPSLRKRSKSPNFRKIFSTVLGFRFEDLAFIRLIPHNNPNRIFELCTYVFPPDKQMRLRTRGSALSPISSGKQIVLSSFNGDICAILEKLANKQTILRGIFTSSLGMSERVKINMNSDAVEKLTAEEIAECPVSFKDHIAKNYRVIRSSSASTGLPDSDPNPGVDRYGPSSSSFPSTGRYCPPPADTPLRDTTQSPTLRQTFPNVLGYRFEDLASIRLIPHNNPHRIFGLQAYVFPSDERIGLRTRKLVLDPIRAGEHMVLSTSNGDVCAVLDKTSSKTTVLRPIFTPAYGIKERVKINMSSGAIKGLTTEEIEECPVTSRGPITKFYRVSLMKTGTLTHRQ